MKNKTLVKVIVTILFLVFVFFITAPRNEHQELEGGDIEKAIKNNQFE